MSIAPHLAADLERIAHPELASDRGTALASIASLPHIDDRKEPLLGPLVRAAKCLALALRRPAPEGVKERLCACASALSEAVRLVPQAAAPRSSVTPSTDEIPYNPGRD